MISKEQDRMFYLEESSWHQRSFLKGSSPQPWDAFKISIARLLASALESGELGWVSLIPSQHKEMNKLEVHDFS